MPIEQVPDASHPRRGTRYAPVEAVRIDQSSGRIQIVVDPEGTYEVVNCRQATEDAGDTALLQVDLKKREAPPAARLDSWAPRAPYDR